MKNYQTEKEHFVYEYVVSMKCRLHGMSFSVLASFQQEPLKLFIV
jgi:hypothetical protein